MKEQGYVYILTNPSVKEEIVKIGITSDTVEKRMKELQTTGVPLPFEKYASYRTSKYAEVEKFMHRSLSLIAENRVNNNREFFNLKPEVALDYLLQVAELLGEKENVESCVLVAEIAKNNIIKRQAFQDKEEWLKENHTEGLSDLIDNFVSKGFGYHLGTSDLRIDITPSMSKKSYNCLMLIGGKDYASFQPSELYKLCEFCNDQPQIVDDLLESLRPYLMKNQKREPYELLTGYYNISYDTLVRNIDKIVSVFSKLITSNK